jgi:hypothetical protein
MQKLTPKQIGILRNKLLRYKAIQEEYLKHKTEDIPMRAVHRKYIYPVFFISIGTLYNVLDTPIDKQLKELESQS